MSVDISDSEINDTYKEICDPKNPTNWFVMVYFKG